MAATQVQVCEGGGETAESQVPDKQDLPQVDELQSGVPSQDLPQHAAAARHVLLAGVLVGLVETQLSRKYFNITS